MLARQALEKNCCLGRYLQTTTTQTPTYVAKKYPSLFNPAFHWKHFEFDHLELYTIIHRKYEVGIENNEVDIFIFMQPINQSLNRLTFCLFPYQNLVPLQFLVVNQHVQCTRLNLDRWNLSMAIDSRDQISKVFLNYPNNDQIVINLRSKKSVIIDLKLQKILVGRMKNYLTAYDTVLIFTEHPPFYDVFIPTVLRDHSNHNNKLPHKLSSAITRATAPYENQNAPNQSDDQIILAKFANIEINNSGVYPTGVLVFKQYLNTIFLMIASDYKTMLHNQTWTPMPWGQIRSGFETSLVAYFFTRKDNQNYIFICPIDILEKENVPILCMSKKLELFFLVSTKNDYNNFYKEIFHPTIFDQDQIEQDIKNLTVEFTGKHGGNFDINQFIRSWHKTRVRLEAMNDRNGNILFKIGTFRVSVWVLLSAILLLLMVGAMMVVTALYIAKRRKKPIEDPTDCRVE